MATIQSGAKQNTKDFKNFSYFLGGIDVTDQNLDQFTPYIQGVSRIFMHKAPPFLTGTTEYASMTERFKSIIESGYTRIDGIGDISVDFVDFEGGFAGQKFSNVSLARDDTDSITISAYELTGSPLREYLDTWITGVRDIRSGIAHYHGQLGAYKYSEKNHTAEFVYATLDPTGKELEYGALFAHCFPTKVSKSHLNYEKGNRDNVLMDMEFKTSKYESPAINEVAKSYITASTVEYNYLNFDPHIPKSAITPNSYGGSGSGNG
jgi:hypothetical protein